MRKILSILFVLFCWSIKANPPKHKLSIYIPNLSSARGYLRLIVFNSPNGFPSDYQKAVFAESYAVKSSSILIELPELPEDNYAIAIFHDENSNNRFDLNLIGVPKEGYGFSNNAKAILGPPSFQDAKIFLNSNVKITMELKYW
ncbi:MAG: DUF2141 domain-containing protein [Cytophagales bacterium]|nr:DUF2141 domain-containing protein [Cytophagales bacterium]MDW8384827.1 DUF2141 domain-containing protein [Flammeovirgaceae bacterium]